jgi:glycerol-3-phosphate dehydrogenase subunit B
VGAVSSRGKVDAVVVRTAAREVRYEARWFVLATGGFGSGGIEMDSHGEVREAVFGLPVWGVPPVGEPMFSPIYLDRHPLARAGVRTDDTLRPIRADGEVIYDNLYTVGATLAGAEPWREKSGEGISLATASRAARTILRRRGRTARPLRKDR